MQTIVINAPSQNSVIHCGEGSFEKYVPEIIAGKQLFIVTDSNVDRLYGRLMEKAFVGAPKYVIAAGEKSKNYKTLIAIIGRMAECNLTRSSLVVAFGGGVVGDIAGLAASLYMRGVHLLQIPTTLLSQVDSSVGGKTAVDYKNVKNLVGTFYQPECVVIDPRFLLTLPAREIRCGLGEIIKYGALNEEIFQLIERYKNRLFTSEFFGEVTPPCVRHKAAVVQADERDAGGARKSLNLGHTTGHAFELFYKKRSHGEFVLIGMYYELFIAARCGIVGGQYRERLENLIKKVVKVPSFENVQTAALLAVHDKKNAVSSEISVVVPKTYGEYAEITLPVEQYARLLGECSECLKSGTAPRLKLAVVGKDVSQSSSPAMHSFIAERMGNALSYEAISLSEDRFEEQIESLLNSYDGLNVTIPYKLSVIPHLKKVVGDAQVFGAVNTVNALGKTGYNTDGSGFMLMLENEGVCVKGKRVLLLGAGGAGRSVAKKLADAGAAVFVYDKNAQGARAVAEEFPGVTALENLQPAPYEIMINATGVGMHKTVGVSPVGGELISLCQTAVDLIYVPEKSRFLEMAEGLGKQIINGSAMLFYQAYYAQCIYFNAQPSAAQAKQLFEEYRTKGQ